MLYAISPFLCLNYAQWAGAQLGCRTDTKSPPWGKRDKQQRDLGAAPRLLESRVGPLMSLDPGTLLQASDPEGPGQGLPISPDSDIPILLLAED